MHDGFAAGFDLIDETLRRLGASDGAAEAHGCLCGLACFFGSRAGPLWLAQLPGATDAAGTAAALLDELAGATCQALVQGDMSLSLLLPPDEQPLSERTTALAGWCAGFMHGLGEAAGHHAGPQALGSATMREIMGDLGEISRAAFADEESDMAAELAYSELVEFVRVSVQLVFEELRELRAAPTATH